ncbi:MAG: helix-turn-helix domain-containing protein, partial [Myxococcota bacterium]
EVLGIGRNVLAQRLKRLVDEKILRRELYQERPKRYEYRLTQKGKELFGIVGAMMRWGDDWLWTDGPPVELRSKATGEVIRPRVVDENTGEPLDIHGVYVTAGPAMPKKYRGHPRFNRTPTGDE